MNKPPTYSIGDYITAVINLVHFGAVVLAILPIAGGFLTTRVIKRTIGVPDAWRPLTIGYPGIEVHFSGLAEPVECVYPPGLDELRDRMFEFLSDRHPGRVIDATSGEDDAGS